MREGIEMIVLIIIDQLRADYVKYLPRCAGLLPHHAICDTNSVPTSTEPMHTNISTGKYPGEHGFISKIVDGHAGGLDEVIEKIRRNELISLSSLARSNGFETCVIGGKPTTVRVMGILEEVTLGVYKGKEGFVVYGGDDLLVSNVSEFSRKLPNMDLNEETDRQVISIFKEVYSRNPVNRLLFVLTLPSLDFVGHNFGPNSAEVEKHLNFLDSEISTLIRQSDNYTAWIVTGDHGCRSTTRYLIEADKDDPRKIAVYRRNEEIFEFFGRYALGIGREFRDAQYDGGILRLWFDAGATSLSDADLAFLSTYGKICGAGYENNVDENLRRLYENSRHHNLGDITVFADVDTTFCRRSWIEEEVLKKKIARGKRLRRGELPTGEHGSHHSEDRLVPCMSSHDFQRNNINNTAIREIIRNMMGSGKQDAD